MKTTISIQHIEKAKKNMENAMFNALLALGNSINELSIFSQEESRPERQARAA
ncbi:hypothetical protein IB286_00715 [Spongiibacter sp. KMU-158]|uniref:Uncharacterized protein n=1 Tax=Spongiibacter pelagi TaxID=2760804 RepID=A0A927GUY4_9GAMM|nr:hypothetical protein [Spongiibacter pelagi]MBD2857508.1 hypothetical protein [Spongiibacter pelagi]